MLCNWIKFIRRKQPLLLFHIAARSNHLQPEPRMGQLSRTLVCATVTPALKIFPAK
jgi:hypothetical protein